MSVDFKHPEYEFYKGFWEKCRDVYEGEEAVKGKGKIYLPRLGSQKPGDNRYTAYKTRSMFYNATYRTVRGLTGAALRKEPTIEFPESKLDLLDSVGPQGESFFQISRMTLSEQLAVGRYGLLVDAEVGEDNPYITWYLAEDIINWRWAIIDGLQVPSLIVLKEDAEVEGDDEFELEQEEKRRVLRLSPAYDERGETQTGWFYSSQLYHEEEKSSGSGKKKEWIPEELLIPTMKGGRTLDRIPFTIFNAEDIALTPKKPPLNDLVNVNLSHYRTSADLEHGRHFTCLPQAWASGFGVPDGEELVIGSETAWVSEEPNAAAGYLEFTGKGLGHLSDAALEKEKLMAILGARLLEEQKRDAEAAETVKLRQAGEGAVLSDIVDTGSEGLTQTLKFYADWIAIPPENVSVEISKDFFPTQIDPQTVIALMQGLQSGSVSFSTWFYNMKRGEMYPDGWTEEDEKEAIDVAPPVSKPAPAVPPGADQKPEEEEEEEQEE
jgi:hypothetical protein